MGKKDKSTGNVKVFFLLKSQTSDRLARFFPAQTWRKLIYVKKNELVSTRARIAARGLRTRLGKKNNSDGDAKWSTTTPACLHGAADKGDVQIDRDGLKEETKRA